MAFPRVVHQRLLCVFLKFCIEVIGSTKSSPRSSNTLGLNKWGSTTERRKVTLSLSFWISCFQSNETANVTSWDTLIYAQLQPACLHFAPLHNEGVKVHRSHSSIRTPGIWGHGLVQVRYNRKKGNKRLDLFSFIFNQQQCKVQLGPPSPPPR